jgi:hypothetical protein
VHHMMHKTTYFLWTVALLLQLEVHLRRVSDRRTSPFPGIGIFHRDLMSVSDDAYSAQSLLERQAKDDERTLRHLSDRADDVLEKGSVVTYISDKTSSRSRSAPASCSPMHPVSSLLIDDDSASAPGREPRGNNCGAGSGSSSSQSVSTESTQSTKSTKMTKSERSMSSVGGSVILSGARPVSAPSLGVCALRRVFGVPGAPFGAGTSRSIAQITDYGNNALPSPAPPLSTTDAAAAGPSSSLYRGGRYSVDVDTSSEGLTVARSRRPPPPKSTKKPQSDGELRRPPPPLATSLGHAAAAALDSSRYVAWPTEALASAAHIAGHVVALSSTALGCRTLKAALDEASAVFGNDSPVALTMLAEIVPSFWMMTCSASANFLIQQLYTVLSPLSQSFLVKLATERVPASFVLRMICASTGLKLELPSAADTLKDRAFATPTQPEDSDRFLPPLFRAALNIFGTRVIQVLIAGASPDDAAEVVALFGIAPTGTIARLARDSCGSHMLTSCLMSHSQSLVDAVAGAILKDLFMLVRCKYAVVNVQRVFDMASPRMRFEILRMLISQVRELAMDPLGNFSLSHVLRCGNEQEATALVESMIPIANQMALNKFASNVLESVLKRDSSPAVAPSARLSLVCALSYNHDEFLKMVSSSYGNFIVQRVAEYAVCAGESSQDMLTAQIVRSALEKISDRLDLSSASGRAISAKISLVAPDIGGARPAWVGNDARNRPSGRRQPPGPSAARRPRGGEGPGGLPGGGGGGGAF